MLFGLIRLSFGQSGLCYKDLCIGMDEKEAKSLIDGTHQSYNITPEQEKEIMNNCIKIYGMVKEDNIRLSETERCTKDHKKKALEDKVEDKYHTIGTLFVKKPELKYLDGKLAEILVRLHYSSDYKVLRNALIDKWGQPTDTSQKEYQNRMGAKFYEIIDTWTKPDGIISYWISPNDNVAYMIRSRDFIIRELNESKQRKSGVRKGL